MDKWIDEYLAGDSVSVIAARDGVPYSRIRYFLIRNGIEIRSAKQAAEISVKTRKPRAHRAFTEAHRQSIIEHRKKWSDENALGVSYKANGYVEYTIGDTAGKSVHVVLIEDRIGRKILPDEVVHHIDGDRSNNDLDNLALMTRTAHSRLHRFEDELAGKVSARDENGRFDQNGEE